MHFTLDDTSNKTRLAGVEGSRSEAFHLTDAVALSEGATRPLQVRGQGEA